jgi:hypothetical protein
MGQQLVCVPAHGQVPGNVDLPQLGVASRSHAVQRVREIGLVAR